MGLNLGGVLNSLGAEDSHQVGHLNFGLIRCYQPQSDLVLFLFPCLATILTPQLFHLSLRQEHRHLVRCDGFQRFHLKIKQKRLVPVLRTVHDSSSIVLYLDIIFYSMHNIFALPGWRHECIFTQVDHKDTLGIIKERRIERTCILKYQLKMLVQNMTQVIILGPMVNFLFPFFSFLVTGRTNKVHASWHHDSIIL